MAYWKRSKQIDEVILIDNNGRLVKSARDIEYLTVNNLAEDHYKLVLKKGAFTSTENLIITK